MFRLAAAEGVLLGEVGVRQMVDRRQQVRELSLIRRDTADRQASETDTMVAPVTSHQNGAFGVAAGLMVGQRDLESRIHRFRPRIREEHVIHVAGKEFPQAAGEQEGLRVTHLEGGRVVEFRDLALNGLDDFPPAVAGVDGPQPGGAVKNPLSIRSPVVHPFGGLEQPGGTLELPIRRERKPAGLEIVRDGRFR